MILAFLAISRGFYRFYWGFLTAMMMLDGVPQSSGSRNQLGAWTALPSHLSLRACDGGCGQSLASDQRSLLALEQCLGFALRWQKLADLKKSTVYQSTGIYDVVKVFVNYWTPWHFWRGLTHAKDVSKWLDPNKGYFRWSTSSRKRSVRLRIWWAPTRPVVRRSLMKHMCRLGGRYPKSCNRPKLSRNWPKKPWRTIKSPCISDHFGY